MFAPGAVNHPPRRLFRPRNPRESCPSTAPLIVPPVRESSSASAGPVAPDERTRNRSVAFADGRSVRFLLLPSFFLIFKLKNGHLRPKGIACILLGIHDAAATAAPSGGGGLGKLKQIYDSIFREVFGSEASDETSSEWKNR